MATPTNLRIGVVATRLGGTDGVSLEVDAWTAVLRELGHEVHFLAGIAETVLDHCTVVPLAFFRHPEVEGINASVFGTSPSDAERVRDARRRIEDIALELRHALECFVTELRLDLLIAENTLSLPVHVPLGLAISRLAANERVPVLAHHHDLPWERDRFASNTVQDYLDEAFPPQLPNVHHACLNSQQRWELEQRIGRTARVIPNVVDMENAPGSSVHAVRLRQDLGLADGELFVLQPTRVVPRKGFEHAIELVRRLERPAALVVTGASGDEGHEYGAHLAELARLLDVRIVWASELVRARRTGHPGGADAYSLDDAFEAADLVTYPSLIEGFGRALLATVRHRRLLVVNRYPVYDRDIRPLGIRAIEMDGFVSDDTVAEVRRLLDDPELRARWADHNEVLVRRHFSTDVLRRELEALLAEMFG